MDGTETLDGERPVEHSLEQGQRFVRRMYLPRVLGAGVGAVCIGGGLWEIGAPLWVWLILAAQCYVWPHLAYRIARRSRDPYRAELHNLMLDSATGGAWVAAMGFNLVPSAVVVAMLAMDKAAVGGLRFLGRCLIAQVVATALVALATGFPLHLASGLAAVVASLPLLIAYPVTVGYTAYRLARRVRQQNDVLSTLSTIDGLTRLLNRTHWEQAVATEFQRCRRIGHSSAVLMLDIDHFKAVNDEHGHQAGDAALTAVAAILQDTLRLHDVAGRYGGEEFGVVLPGINTGGASAIAERIRRRIEQAVVEQRRGLRVTISIGYAALTPDDNDHGAWIARADRALYAAKAAGRNRCMGHEQRQAA
ncbi:MAG TPA: diguanylate cyclase [Burkholderiales bacterium]|nr:diguanylate cyclase [Burkholderiales bacterium]